jgi:ribosomal-protein-alanine N-acetyltransferase
MTGIVTERLKLIPLNLENLSGVKRGKQHIVEDNEHIRLMNPVTYDDVLRAMDVKIAMMERVSVKDHPWLTYWLVVIPDDHISVGMVGFKGLPDKTGEVEIGYGIDPAFRERGYATEAAKALVEWALNDPRCSVIMADANKDNYASIRVLEKIGMRLHSETDEMVMMKLSL